MGLFLLCFLFELTKPNIGAIIRIKMPELIREARFFMIILVIILDLFITAFSYLLVPVIFIIRGKKMARKQLWKISIINGCCVCFAFIILRAILEVKHSSWAVALYTPIGHWIMSKYLWLPDNGDPSDAQ